MWIVLPTWEEGILSSCFGASPGETAQDWSPLEEGNIAGPLGTDLARVAGSIAVVAAYETVEHTSDSHRHPPARVEPMRK